MEQKSLFIEFFGDYPIIRVLDFLIENEIFDYSKKDIAKYSEVSWNTLEKFFEKLLERGIIVRTRKVGKSQMYKINLENPIVQKLMEIDKRLMLESIPVKTEKIVKVKA
jgi:DNA-binding transcriptional ArsR family regulator